jgi:hypothetical protein
MAGDEPDEPRGPVRVVRLRVTLRPRAGFEDTTALTAQ